MYIVVKPCPGGRWNVRMPGFIGVSDEPTERVPGLVAGFMEEIGDRKYNERIPEVDPKTSRTDGCIVIAPGPKVDRWFVHTPDDRRLMTRPSLVERLPEFLSNLCPNPDTVRTDCPDTANLIPTPDSENLSLYKVNGGFIAVDDGDNEYVFTTAASIAEWVGRWGDAPKVGE